MVQIGKSGEVSREQVWLSAWLTVAAAENCVYKDAPARWADRCLEDFDARFPPKPAEETKG